jgi:predicted nucleotidyltransferase
MVEGLLAHLDDLKDQFVLVGGCATGLLVTDPARPQVRATTDIDLVVSIATKGDYQNFSEQLRARGFREDAESDAICRWKIDSFEIDILPTEEDILGFSNRWYKAAFDTSTAISLPGGLEINLISSPLFIATKLEAFHDRGNEKYDVSHDIEDIITVVDGRVELLEEIENTPEDVKEYLQEEFELLLAEPNFFDSLSWHLSPDPANQNRLPMIIKKLRTISGL